MSELPNGWAIVGLPQVAVVLDTRRIPLNADERTRRIAGKAAGSLVPYYGATGQVGWIDEALFDENLVLLGEDGAPFLDLQKQKAYRIVGKSWVNNHAHVLRAREGVLDWRLLEHQLNTIDYTGFVTGTTRLKLTQGAMNTLPILVPPFQEQTRIANQLDTLLTRVQACNDRFDAIPALLKRFRQTLLRAATSGDLTVDWRKNNFGEDAASDFTEVRVGDPYSHAIRAPKLWKESSLGATCDFVGGSQPPKSTFTYENGDDLVRLIQIRDYKSDRHTTYIPKTLARRFCNKTDVMIGRYGPPIFQILRGLEGAYNVALMKAVPRTNDIDLEYLYVFLRGDQLLKFIEAGSDRTAGQDGVRKELLTPYPIFLPSLSEQAEIVRRVEGMLALVDRIEARCTTARTQAQRLTPLVLAKAFRGELVPQDPNDEPASALLARIASLNTVVAGKNKRKVPVALMKIA